MISYPEAQRIILEESGKRIRPAEKIELSRALGRYLSQDIAAPISIQPFDNSAMDGYVLRSEDTRKAAENAPVELSLKGMIAAGSKEDILPLSQGECYKIMTGAPVPVGGDTIIPVEEAQVVGGTLRIDHPLLAGNHIREAGADIKQGEMLLKGGNRIDVSDLLPLASLGVSAVSVRTKPEFAFISTGDEIIDDLSQPLREGEIYNSNQIYGIAYLEQLGAVCRQKISLRDKPEQFRKSVEEIISKNSVDIIVSSGAVSAGDYDFVKAGLESLGARILFHKVKIKPGKPVLFAVLPNGALYFGLPGNPAATAAGLRFFVTPAILAVMGAREERPVRLPLSEALRKKNELRLFLKAVIDLGSGETPRVLAMDGQESFRVRPFLAMNGWVVFPENLSELERGAYADFYPEFPDSRQARKETL